MNTPPAHRFLARLPNAPTERDARLALVEYPDPKTGQPFGRFRAVNAKIVADQDGGYVAFLHLAYDEGVRS